MSITGIITKIIEKDFDAIIFWLYADHNQEDFISTGSNTIEKFVFRMERLNL